MKSQLGDNFCQEYVVLIDPGSYQVRIGTHDIDLPLKVFHSLIGEAKLASLLPSNLNQFCFGFNEPWSSYNFSPMVKNGQFIKSEFLEKILRNYFSQNSTVKGINQGIVFSQPQVVNKQVQNEMIEICFEKFNFNFLSFVPEILGQLYSSGSRTGLVVDVGHNLSQVGLVFKDRMIRDSFVQMEFGGQNLDFQLRDFLGDLFGYKYYKQPMYIYNDIKNMILGLEQNLQNQSEFCQYYQLDQENNNFVLPDGNQFKIDQIKPLLSQLLFSQKDSPKSNQNINNLLRSSFDTLDQQLKRVSLGNILVTGGSSQMFNFKENLQRTLANFVQRSDKISLMDLNQDPSLMTIKGLQILSKTNNLNSFSINFNQYKEIGQDFLIRNNIQIQLFIMKNLFLNLLLIISTIRANTFQCPFAVQVNPMIQNHQLQVLYLNLNFYSTCWDMVHILTLIATTEFGVDQSLTQLPNIVQLNFQGSQLELEYSNPSESIINRYQVEQFTQVTLRLNQLNIALNPLKQNRVLITENNRNINVHTMKYIQDIKEPILCNVDVRLRKTICNL